MDAVVAISLVDLSMQDCTLDDTADALHSTIPKYPDFEYLCTAKKLLTRLNLIDIWRNELLYYAKLLQVDHKTLESDLEVGNCKLFAKHDDVTDDNIQLSASLITSSYFNNKKANKTNENTIVEDFENKKKDKEFKNDGINERFAVTLKKHKTLNSTEKEPPNIKKKGGNKRKRKEVTVDITGVKNKLVKRAKKSKGKANSNEDHESNSDEEFVEEQIVLKAVPSVNDALADLGIDFHFDNGSDEINVNIDETSVNNESNNDKSEPKETETPKKIDTSEENLDSVLDISIEIGTKNADVKERTVSKLKQFQFVSKHDLDKYDDKPRKPLDNKTTDNVIDTLKLKENNIDKSASNTKASTSKSQFSMFEGIDTDSNETILGQVKGKENTSTISNQKPSNPSSQISMFESSDCDIDLDI